MPSIALPPTPAKLLQVPYQSADWILDQLQPLGRLVCLTKGHLSLTDMIGAALAKTGHARVLLCVWGMTWGEISRLHALFTSGKITAIRIIAPNAGKDAADYDIIRKMFGPGSVVNTAIHAKIACVEAGDWHIAIRGSMNLYACSHAEQLDIDDSAAVCAEAWRFADAPATRARYPKPAEEMALARAALAPLTPAGRVFGITDGFSLPALVRAALEITAKLSIVTARLGKKEAQELGAFPDVRVVLGQSVVGVAKDAARAAQVALGSDRIRVHLAHAKIVTIRNQRWSLTLRSSMNFCANLRAEQFDITDDAAIADQADAWVAFIFAETPAGIATPNTTLGAVLRRSLNDDTKEERARPRWTEPLQPLDLSKIVRSERGAAEARFFEIAHGEKPPFAVEATAVPVPRPAAPIDLSRYAQQALPFTR
jgi:hypothetical protein